MPNCETAAKVLLKNMLTGIESCWSNKNYFSINSQEYLCNIILGYENARHIFGKKRKKKETSLSKNDTNFNISFEFISHEL